MYVREMGTVPVLTREGEGESGKGSERGQLRVLKALSGSPIVIKEILGLGEDLKKGVRSIKELVAFEEEEITEDIAQARLKDFTGKIDEVGKHYKKVQQVTEKLATIIQKKKPKEHRRSSWALGRAQVQVSIGIRNLKFTNPERKRLIDRVNKTVDIMRSLDRQVNNLEKKIEATRSDDQKKEFRRLQRQHRADLEKLEQEAGVSYQELKRTQREIIHGDVDAEAANRELIEANLRLAGSIAKKYTNPGLQFLNRIQQGKIGPTKAVQNFHDRLDHN